MDLNLGRREAHRLALEYIREAVMRPMVSRTADLRWNIQPGSNEEGDLIGGQHPGAAALTLVRRALASFHVPSVALRFIGMKRTSGRDAFVMDEGVVTIEATLTSLSGPKRTVDIPVVVHAGRALMPSILIDSGLPRILAQSTFDDIVGRGEFRAVVPDRTNMFSPPSDSDRKKKETMALVRPSSMFAAPSRSLIRGAMRGFVAAGTETGPLDPLWEPDVDDDDPVWPSDLMAPDEPPVLSKDTSSFGGGGARVLKRVDPRTHEALENLRKRNMEKYLFEDDAYAGELANEQSKQLEQAMPMPLAPLEEPLPRPKPRGDTVDEGIPLDVPIVEGKPLRRPKPRSAAGVHRVAESDGRFDREAFYEPDVTGVLEPGSLGRDVPGASGTHLDVAERMPVGKFAPGQRVKTKKEHKVRDRGGVVFVLSKGTEGKVVRDYDGADYAYIVRFDMGDIKMPREALS
jgi:hypothetical protein